VQAWPSRACRRRGAGPSGVTACTERFSGHEGVRFEVNDGRSLPMVPDGSVDLVSSFDSLVHVKDDVTAERFAELSRDAGLVCIGQEIINWASPLLIDCISIVTQLGSTWERPNVCTTNRYFRAAARSSATSAQVFLSMEASAS
jgi:hypothetical protein